MTAAETLPGGYDHVIVGAGSAGCVLANRLSADPAARVLLLEEAGGSDRHPHVLALAGFLKTFRNPRFNWCFETEPGPGVDGRAIFPRGKALGGSSSINGSLWVRGQARDFDTWAQRGCAGWSWADVPAAFRAIEDHAGGADEWRGASGPQHVSAVAERHPICDAFIAGAAAECGLPLNPDHNGASQEGAFYYQRSIRRGRRHSAATGFLRPALRRPNLRVEAGALALRLEVDGRRTARRRSPACAGRGA
jgi:choline dehydrogenase